MKRLNVKGEGFTILKDYDGWRLASITYEYSKNSLEGFQTFGKHKETDEAFILLTGKASMVLGGFNDKVEDLKVKKLKKEEIFIVEKGEWHAILVENDTKVLVVENRDTDETNTVIEKVTNLHKKSIKKI